MSSKQGSWGQRKKRKKKWVNICPRLDGFACGVYKHRQFRVCSKEEDLFVLGTIYSIFNHYYCTFFTWGSNKKRLLFVLNINTNRISGCSICEQTPPLRDLTTYLCMTCLRSDSRTSRFSDSCQGYGFGSKPHSFKGNTPCKQFIHVVQSTAAVLLTR